MQCYDDLLYIRSEKWYEAYLSIQRASLLEIARQLKAVVMYITLSSLSTECVM